MRKVSLLRVVCLVIALPVFAAAEVNLTVYSVPAGATLTEGAVVPGMTPFTIRYQTKGLKKDACRNYQRITVTWPSGAHASTAGEVTICEKAGKQQSMTFARPTGVPGAELDFQYAVQLEQLALMQQQIAVQQMQQNAAQAAAMQASRDRNYATYMQSLQNYSYHSRQVQLSLSCTTQAIGQFIYTNCR